MQQRGGSGNLSLQVVLWINRLLAPTPAVLGPLLRIHIAGVCVMCDRTVTGIKPARHKSTDCGGKGTVDRQGKRVEEGREMRWAFILVTACPGGETAA